MPNPDLPLPDEVIESQWGQATVSRIVPVYDTAPDRDADIQVAEDGQLAYVLDDDILTVRVSGTTWKTVGVGTFLQLTGGVMTGAINMGGHAIGSLPTPTASTDAATKGYVDGFLPLTGGTITGLLYIDSSGIRYPGVGGNNAIAFDWGSGRVTAHVDNTESSVLANLTDTEGHLPLTGGTLTGDLSLDAATPGDVAALEVHRYIDNDIDLRISVLVDKSIRFIRRIDGDERAWINLGPYGLKTGTATLSEGVVRNVYTGTDVPSDSLGADGDLYVRHTP